MSIPICLFKFFSEFNRLYSKGYIIYAININKTYQKVLVPFKKKVIKNKSSKNNLTLPDLNIISTSPKKGIAIVKYVGIILLILFL